MRRETKIMLTAENMRKRDFAEIICENAWFSFLFGKNPNKKNLSVNSAISFLCPQGPAGG
jgi:hypothetical protein